MSFKFFVPTTYPPSFSLAFPHIVSRKRGSRGTAKQYYLNLQYKRPEPLPTPPRECNDEDTTEREMISSVPPPGMTVGWLSGSPSGAVGTHSWLRSECLNPASLQPMTAGRYPSLRDDDLSIDTHSERVSIVTSGIEIDAPAGRGRAEEGRESFRTPPTTDRGERLDAEFRSFFEELLVSLLLSGGCGDDARAVVQRFWGKELEARVPALASMEEERDTVLACEARGMEYIKVKYVFFGGGGGVGEGLRAKFGLTFYVRSRIM